MCIVFPGEADASEDGDGFGDGLNGWDNGCFNGGACGQRLLVFVLVKGDECGPGCGRAEFGGNEQVCALVLDGLEGPDRGTKLFADLGVVGGFVNRPAHDAGSLGGEQAGAQGFHVASAQSVEDCLGLDGQSVEHQRSGVAGQIRAVRGDSLQSRAFHVNECKPGDGVAGESDDQEFGGEQRGHRGAAAQGPSAVCCVRGEHGGREDQCAGGAGGELVQSRG